MSLMMFHRPSDPLLVLRAKLLSVVPRCSDEPPLLLPSAPKSANLGANSLTDLVLDRLDELLASPAFVGDVEVIAADEDWPVPPSTPRAAADAGPPDAAAIREFTRRKR